MPEELHKGATGNIFNFARNLRKDETDAEKILWRHLRNRNLNGFKFRRQHPLSNFIADFYCHQAMLVIEIDGKIHLDPSQCQYDKERTQYLESLRIRVIRFSNDEINHDIRNVLDAIRRYLIPNPSPEGEGNV